MNYSYLNTGTSIPVRTGYNILIHAAISGFTANGVNVPTTIFYSYNVNTNETV